MGPGGRSIGQLKSIVMKIFFALCFALPMAAFAQESRPERHRLPLTVTIFSESVSLPNFRNVFKNGHLGIRVGTELYYTQSAHRQWLQTINVGYYRHKNLQSGLYISSEGGYRHFFGNAFADATVGVGYLLLDSALPRYERTSSGFAKVSSLHHRVMPTIGVGAGYRFDQFTVFSRYELFGEMPFGFKGIPALPHKAVHVGTRIAIK
jgi:hypothetical protein